MIGNRFSRLLVTATEGDGRHLWCICRCDCGGLSRVRATSLRNGNTRSCGCLRRDVVKDRSKSHGLHGTPEYRCWKTMRQRCTNPRNPKYPSYGGRGITVCERWNSFEMFVADMGPRPSPRHSIDRINNDLGYSPENCRWASEKSQARNRRSSRVVTCNGESRTVAEWSELTGMNRYKITGRLRLGWSPEAALGFVEAQP